MFYSQRFMTNAHITYVDDISFNGINLEIPIVDPLQLN